MRLLCIALFLLTFGAYADEPTTIIRHRGKAGLAERVEKCSAGGLHVVVGGNGPLKSSTETVVRVQLDKIVGTTVIQKRIELFGTDTFDSKPKPERKATAKERPQPASVKPLKAKVGQ